MCENKFHLRILPNSQRNKMSKLCKSFIFAVSLGRVLQFSWTVSVQTEKVELLKRLRGFTYLTALWSQSQRPASQMGAASFFWKGHFSTAPSSSSCVILQAVSLLCLAPRSPCVGQVQFPGSCHVLSSAPCWSHPTHISYSALSLLSFCLITLLSAWLFTDSGCARLPCSLFLPYQTCCLRPACPHTWPGPEPSLCYVLLWNHSSVFPSPGRTSLGLLCEVTLMAFNRHFFFNLIWLPWSP